MGKIMAFILSTLVLAGCYDNRDYAKEEADRQRRIEIAKKIDEENLKKPIKISAPAELKYIPPTCHHPKGWAGIGMTKEEVVHCGWGRPDKINKYTTSFGTTEQWVYRTRVEGYLYFDTDGRLTSMYH